MGKVNSLHKLVPCRSLCKRLSKEEFKDTAMVWFKVPETSFEDSFWILDTRARLEALEIDLSLKEYYPAPTAQEFMERLLPTYSSELLQLERGDLQQWYLTYSPMAFWKAIRYPGKTIVASLCKIYLKYQSENK